jgi:hypothetical protein
LHPLRKYTNTATKVVKKSLMDSLSSVHLGKIEGSESGEEMRDQEDPTATVYHPAMPNR